MASIQANGITIEYDTFGDRAGRPLLLIMGLGGQMIHWDEAFCRDLAGRGHFVIRFDNRDVGLSTHFDQAGVPRFQEVMAAAARGERIEVPYSLDDMADDAFGLLDGLGLPRAHVCGASMGGMIAQAMAIRHPARLLSLISIMSRTGDPAVAVPAPEVMAALSTPAPVEREAFIEHTVKMQRIVGSPGFPLNEQDARERAARAFDRAFDPAGVARQMAAVMAQSNRKPALASLRVPTLVIHGSSDPLVPVEAGYDTAQAVPGAEMLVIEGMGHEMPKGAWPRIVEAISAHTAKVQR
jgi:pimeloyl-ACP methyl ester carboxylesterase